MEELPAMKKPLEKDLGNGFKIRELSKKDRDAALEGKIQDNQMLKLGVVSGDVAALEDEPYSLTVEIVREIMNLSFGSRKQEKN